MEPEAAHLPTKVLGAASVGFTSLGARKWFPRTSVARPDRISDLKDCPFPLDVKKYSPSDSSQAVKLDAKGSAASVNRPLKRSLDAGDHPFSSDVKKYSTSAAPQSGIKASKLDAVVAKIMSKAANKHTQSNRTTLISAPSPSARQSAKRRGTVNLEAQLLAGVNVVTFPCNSTEQATCLARQSENQPVKLDPLYRDCQQAVNVVRFPSGALKSGKQDPEPVQVVNKVTFPRSSIKQRTCRDAKPPPIVNRVTLPRYSSEQSAYSARKSPLNWDLQDPQPLLVVSTAAAPNRNVKQPSCRVRQSGNHPVKLNPQDPMPFQVNTISFPRKNTEQPTVNNLQLGKQPTKCVLNVPNPSSKADHTAFRPSEIKRYSPCFDRPPENRVVCPEAPSSKPAVSVEGTVTLGAKKFYPVSAPKLSAYELEPSPAKQLCDNGTQTVLFKPVITQEVVQQLLTQVAQLRSEQLRSSEPDASQDQSHSPGQRSAAGTKLTARNIKILVPVSPYGSRSPRQKSTGLINEVVKGSVSDFIVKTEPDASGKLRYRDSDVHASITLACVDCSVVCSDEKALFDHRYVFHPFLPYKCQHCRKSFRHFLSLSTHVQLVHESARKQTLLASPVSGAALQQKCQSPRLQRCRPKPFRFEECCTGFVGRTALAKHMEAHMQAQVQGPDEEVPGFCDAPTAVDETVTCGVCPMTFSSVLSASIHSRLCHNDSQEVSLSPPRLEMSVSPPRLRSPSPVIDVDEDFFEAFISLPVSPGNRVVTRVLEFSEY